MSDNGGELPYKYEFAISFAGDKRELAQRLAQSLRQVGFRVFFDEFLEHELLGANAADYFTQVFGRDSRFCIALISSQYDERDWTRIEREVIQARQLSDRTNFLLPVMTDTYRPQWLPAT